MKKSKIVFLGALVPLIFILTACPKPNLQPEQDSETQSAVSASYLNYMVSDIEMMISFIGEDQFTDFFYATYGNSGGTVTPVRDPEVSGQGRFRVSFNNTLCRDGRTRSGSIYLSYKLDPNYPNARHIRSYKFSGDVQFSAFSVDDYNIDLNIEDGGYLHIANTLPSEVYSTKNAKMTWSIDGKLKFTHLYDSKKNMVWEGHWTKTLVNSNNPRVVASTTTAINWYNAEISYVGKTTGKVPITAENGEITPLVPFSMNFNPEYPLSRDFKCSSDPIGGVENTSGGVMTPVYSEHHPFVSGIASFTIGSAYPREIYYANEGQKSALPNTQCDNSGEVLIKGISYRVDFMK